MKQPDTLVYKGVMHPGGVGEPWTGAPCYTGWYLCRGIDWQHFSPMGNPSVGRLVKTWGDMYHNFRPTIQPHPQTWPRVQRSGLSITGVTQNRGKKTCRTLLVRIGHRNLASPRPS